MHSVLSITTVLLLLLLTACGGVTLSPNIEVADDSGQDTPSDNSAVAEGQSPNSGSEPRPSPSLLPDLDSDPDLESDSNLGSGLGSGSAPDEINDSGSDNTLEPLPDESPDEDIAIAKLYQQQCQACHGNKGSGQPQGSSILLALESNSVINTIARSMPISNPDACDEACAQAMVAWLRAENDAGQNQAPEKTQVVLENPEQSYRRASLFLRGEIPSEQRLAEVAGLTDEQLRSEILALMQGPGFHEFIKRSANDKLLVRGTNLGPVNFYNALKPYYSNLAELIELRDEQGLNDYNKSLAEEPLELIAYIVENDRPYSEILTADYTVVDEALDLLYQSNKQPGKNWVKAVNQGQHVRSNSKKLYESDRRIELPHAGILSTLAYNLRWPSSETNRNRARAKYIMLNFLGFDIEAVAARDFSDEELADADNPTLNNPACAQCHEALDPIAGAFQNVGNNGTFLDRLGADGLDALDAVYVKNSALYNEGDRWYADMRKPGYYGALLNNDNHALRWLAEQLVNDERFAEATVKFWWPALFGEQLLHDKLSEAQYRARQAVLDELAADFRMHENLKWLLADMIMSPWFRASAVRADVDMALENIGAKRLLTPEEASAKLSSLAGLALDDYQKTYSSYFGGIDSYNSVQRGRELAPLMYKVAERVALDRACSVVVSDFNRPQAQRELFPYVTKADFPGQRFIAMLDTFTQSTVADGGADELGLELKSSNEAMQVELQLFSQVAYLADVSLVDASGRELWFKSGLDFVNEFLVSGSTNSANNKLSGEKDAAYLRTSEKLLFELPSVDGAQQLKFRLWRKNSNKRIAVFVHTVNTPGAFEPQSNPEFTSQLVYLARRFYGESWAANSDELHRLAALFQQARALKLERGAHGDIKESGQYCNYSDPEKRNEREWGDDPWATLSAWRTVLVAMMSDMQFIYE
ncbi:c-type cytochrome [Agaribacterium haliotis]|uniref:c-type cytochrome n=1 Tax=Agaribacterium haliotis TaxID=2013869 RepID=UPI000BB55BE7|nr:c-type cytochrome [Agaribacterium haliotis]